MISNPFPDAIADASHNQREREGWASRWLISLLVLLGIGWAWPYDPASVPGRLTDAGWSLGWLTVLVLVGGAIGYILQSRWSVLVAPIGLYAGGVVHWFQFEWGFTWPIWEDFAAVSAIALGVLFLTAGLSAGVACRVVSPEPRRFDHSSQTVRLSAAVATLLGLIALTVINILPFPYLGGLLGFAAILSGIAVMQEDRAGHREHVLAIAGMIFGVAATTSQIYELWSFVQNL